MTELLHRVSRRLHLRPDVVWPEVDVELADEFWASRGMDRSREERAKEARDLAADVAPTRWTPPALRHAR